MKTVLLIIGIFSLSECLCERESDCANSSLGCEAERQYPGRTFHGSPPEEYEKIPHSAIEGLPKPNSKRENQCSPEKSNISALKVNNTTMEYLTSSMSMKLIPALYITVVLIGVPSNAITLWMLLFKIRSVRTAIFYTNLAISDFIFCIMLPFKITYHLGGNNWIFGEAMCRITTAIFYGNMYCSTLFLTCISISRYVAIVHPFTYRTLPKRPLATLACVIIWAIVFLYMLPLIVVKQSYRLDQLNIITCHDVHNTCSTPSPFQYYYFISMAVFGFLIPLCIVIFCYVSIIRALRDCDQKWLWYIKVSFLVLSIFAVCFTPSNIILIAHHVNYYHTSKDNLYCAYLTALCLSSLNSCLDPFLYFLMSKIKVKSYFAIVKSVRAGQR